MKTVFDYKISPNSTQTSESSTAVNSHQESQQPIIEEIRNQSERQKSKDEVKQAKDNPSGNRIVSDERYAELREKMKKKLSQLNMGIDPELLEIGVEMAFLRFKGGMRQIADFCKTMIEDCRD